jgi:hypothetical protein
LIDYPQGLWRGWPLSAFLPSAQGEKLDEKMEIACGYLVITFVCAGSRKRSIQAIATPPAILYNAASFSLAFTVTLKAYK